jgi:hypothetical protein
VLRPRSLDEPDPRSLDDPDPRSLDELDPRSFDEPEPRSVDEPDPRSLDELESRSLDALEPRSLDDPEARPLDRERFELSRSSDEVRSLNIARSLDEPRSGPDSRLRICSVSRIDSREPSACSILDERLGSSCFRLRFCMRGPPARQGVLLPRSLRQVECRSLFFDELDWGVISEVARLRGRLRSSDGDGEASPKRFRAEAGEFAS